MFATTRSVPDVQSSDLEQAGRQFAVPEMLLSGLTKAAVVLARTFVEASPRLDDAQGDIRCTNCLHVWGSPDAPAHLSSCPVGIVMRLAAEVADLTVVSPADGRMIAYGVGAVMLPLDDLDCESLGFRPVEVSHAQAAARHHRDSAFPATPIERGAAK